MCNVFSQELLYPLIQKMMKAFTGKVMMKACTGRRAVSLRVTMPPFVTSTAKVLQYLNIFIILVHKLYCRHMPKQAYVPSSALV